MNQGTLSGTIVGEFKEVGIADNKGIRFDVEVALNPKKPDEKEKYPVVAYAANAELIKANAKAGYRVNLEHRLGSDKVSDGLFDSVLVVSKVLGILADAKLGMDYATIIIGGSAKFRKFNTTPSGSQVLNASVKISKEFNGKVTTTYADVALWNKLAQDNSERAESETDVVVAGTPRPKVVDKDGVGNYKMDIWANSVMFASAGEESAGGSDESDSSESSDAPKESKFRKRTLKSEEVAF